MRRAPLESIHLTPSDRSFRTVIVALVVAVATLAVFAPVTVASTPELLTRIPTDGVRGSGAGEIDVPEGIVANPNLPGDIYVLDGSNSRRVDEFTPWGEFVQAFGWGVTDGNAELESCTQVSGCRQGLGGAGTGEIGSGGDPTSIAIGPSGRLYVLEPTANHRVQVFDLGGHFLFMFGSEVNKTAVEEGRINEVNVCPASGHAADKCQAGKGGIEPGELDGTVEEAGKGRIAVSPVDGTIFVGERGHIQEFNPDGSYKESIALPEGKTAAEISVDSEGNLYVHMYAGLFEGNDDKEVHKLRPGGPSATFLTPSFAVENPESEETLGSVAVDGEGNVFVAVGEVQIGGVSRPAKELEFDAAGNCLDCGVSGEGGAAGFARPTDGSGIYSIGTGNACGSADLYVGNFAPTTNLSLSYLDILGSPPDPSLCPPPMLPPEIGSEYASSVGTQTAQLRAEINPKFWTDTKYYVEYGSSPCSEGGCAAKPTAPGVTLTSRVLSGQVKSGSVFLNDLTPGVSYHYRFVAVSSGGGPVYGEDRTFTTSRSEGAQEPCLVNEAFRVGPSAALPDCRAYEMVSPLDKEGGDIEALLEAFTYVPTVLTQSAVSGERLAYGSYRSFAGAQSAPWTTQYIASRTQSGWFTHPISPPHGELITSDPTSGAYGLETEFKAFSADLCQSWLVTSTEPRLSADAVSGKANIYRRQDEECGGVSFESLTTLEPPHGYRSLQLQGVSSDGSKAVYAVEDNLTPEAPELAGKALALYYQQAGEGPSQYVCILPDGKPIDESCSTGMDSGGGSESVVNNLDNGLSADGSKVFWTASPVRDSAGRIYLRENPGAEQSAIGNEGCLEPEKACTIAVSKEAEEQSGFTESRYWTAAKDGSKAVFTTEGGGKDDLYLFDLAEDKDHFIAHETLGVMGASEDASYVYFASSEALGGTNSQGRSATAGVANLYVYHEGQVHFIATSSMGFDLTTLSAGAFSSEPRYRTARVTGQYAVFVTSTSLTGYDNHDVTTGKADSEVYLYSAAAAAGGGRLTCVSCNPTGARPAGGEVKQSNEEFSAAGWLPAWENSLYASRVLSDDGSRVFFDAMDSLTSHDTNGVEDVYEWEAPGHGSCTEASSEYSIQDEGCIYLISSGQSPRASEFVDASPSGNDVFIATLSGLVSQDTGLVDIYDARVDGGFPAPASQRASCEGEACQAPPASPLDATPGSLTFTGPGNPSSEPLAQAKTKSKTLVRAQKLKQALNACHKQAKKKRSACERRARKRYRAGKASTARQANRRRSKR